MKKCSSNNKFCYNNTAPTYITYCKLVLATNHLSSFVCKKESMAFVNTIFVYYFIPNFLNQLNIEFYHKVPQHHFYSSIY